MSRWMTIFGRSRQLLHLWKVMVSSWSSIRFFKFSTNDTITRRPAMNQRSQGSKCRWQPLERAPGNTWCAQDDECRWWVMDPGYFFRLRELRVIFQSCLTSTDRRMQVLLTKREKIVDAPTTYYLFCTRRRRSPSECWLSRPCLIWSRNNRQQWWRIYSNSVSHVTEWIVQPYYAGIGEWPIEWLEIRIVERVNGWIPLNT